MALNDGKTLKLLRGKGKSSRLCTSLSIDRENLFQFFLTFVKNAIQLCTCYKCSYKFSFLVNVYVSPLSCLLHGTYFFQASRSIANKRYEWQVAKSVYVAIIIFLPGRKKRTRNLPFAQMGVHFSCRMIHSRDACIPGRKKKNKKSSVRVDGRAFFV